MTPAQAKKIVIANNDRRIFPSQDRDYNCGSTAVFSAMRAIGLNPGLTPHQVECIVGTNPVIGTTMPLIEAGIAKLGLKAEKLNLFDFKSYNSVNTDEVVEIAASIQSERLLRDLVRDDIAILRTVMDGSRHWIVVLSFNPATERYVVHDPSRHGLCEMRADYLRKCWGLQKCQGLLLPFKRDEHPASKTPVRKQDAARLTVQRADYGEIALTRPEDFLSPRSAKERPVGYEGTGQAEMIDVQTEDSIAYLARTSRLSQMAHDIHADQARPMAFKSKAHPDLSFFAERGDDHFNAMTVRNAHGDVVGGCREGWFYVDLFHRKKGYGREIVLATLSDPRLNFLDKTMLTPGGSATLLAALRQITIDTGLYAPEQQRMAAP